MKYINAQRIQEALAAPMLDVRTILAKSLRLERLSLAEAATLLKVEDPALLNELFTTAKKVKDEIYGKRIVLFAPLYISNICTNSCVYCAFQAGNTAIERKALSIDEIKEQTKHLISRGHKRILLVAGEAAPKGQALIDFYTSAIEAMYSVHEGANYIRRININCAPLTVEEFKKLKAAKIGTFQIFQETYHDATYAKVHPNGPKSNPDNRLEAVDRAFEAGIDDIGIGVLYGLYDYRFDTLGLLSHVEAMEAKHKVGPHTISVPRIEPALGSDFSTNIPHKVSDLDFKKIVAVLRLAVPYTGIILSTRETAQMREELLDLGISQMSAESNTSPGGYASTSLSTSSDAADNGQFTTADHRSLDEIISSLVEHGYTPSFCTGCYRTKRTGTAFMDLAKPGLIKGKCSMNALLTLKEYLDDFGTEETKTKGYALIEKMQNKLNPEDQIMVGKYLAEITAGIRDRYL